MDPLPRQPLLFQDRTANKQNQQRSVTSRGVEYDPTSKKSIQEFLKNPDIKKEIYRNESTGDLYYLDRENSSFIVIEGGDYDKIQSILVTNLSEDSGAWEKVTGEQLQQRARIYMVAKDSIQAGVKDINKKRGKDDPLTFKSFVIDPKYMHVRGYLSPEITDTTTIKTGSLIQIDKGIWERIDNIVKSKDEKGDRRTHDKKTTENDIDDEESLLNRKMPKYNFTTWDPNADVDLKYNGYVALQTAFKSVKYSNKNEALNIPSKPLISALYNGYKKMPDFDKLEVASKLSSENPLIRKNALTTIQNDNKDLIDAIKNALAQELGVNPNDAKLLDKVNNSSHEQKRLRDLILEHMKIDAMLDQGLKNIN